MSSFHRWLLISGVNISAAASTFSPHEPIPDFLVLREDSQPDIIDVETIKTTRNIFLRVILRIWGPYWAVVAQAFFVAGRYRAIVATGEDVGLPLALFSKIFRRNIPLVVTCHNIATRRPRFYLKQLQVASSVRKFLCLSKSQGHILQERYNISPEKIRVIAWHVDHQFFQPMPQVEPKRQICSAGMASRDYALLVEAARPLNIDVKIAADSPWFKQALNISSEDLPAFVSARSYGNYAALRQLYAESLFVVVPLFDVNFSAGYSVILEAMAMGKAVIVSKIQQNDDFIVDAWNGFYVKPGDVNDLRSRIQYLLDHPDEARQLGANGRKCIEEGYTLAHYLQHMRLVLQELEGTDPP